MKYDIDHEFVSISSQTANHRIILEDYNNDKFTLSKDIDIKTWLK